MQLEVNLQNKYIKLWRHCQVQLFFSPRDSWRCWDESGKHSGWRRSQSTLLSLCFLVILKIKFINNCFPKSWEAWSWFLHEQVANSPLPEVTECFPSLLMTAAVWNSWVKSHSTGTPWPCLCLPSITGGQTTEGQNVHLSILHKTKDVFSHTYLQKQNARALFSVRLSTSVLSKYPQDFFFHLAQSNANFISLYHRFPITSSQMPLFCSHRLINYYFKGCLQEFVNQNTTSTCLSSNSGLWRLQTLLEKNQWLLTEILPFTAINPLRKYKKRELILESDKERNWTSAQDFCSLLQYIQNMHWNCPVKPIRFICTFQGR